MQMARYENDPDLNLQSFNDHGIFTIYELEELFPVVKSYFSALHLNTRRWNQHFADLCNLIDSILLLLILLDVRRLCSHLEVMAWRTLLVYTSVTPYGFRAKAGKKNMQRHS